MPGLSKPFKMLLAVAAISTLAVALPAEAGSPALQRGGPLRDPFFSYSRAAQFTETIATTDVHVPLRDGSHLSCDLSRPGRSGRAEPGRFPGLVLEYTGYALVKDTSAVDYFVQRGYNVLICDARGSGNSPGELDPFSAQEQRDNYDAIEWFAKQPWSSGRIGQSGVSYGAHSSLLVAVNRPPHLKTIIPVMGIHDWYENTIYRGGIESTSIAGWEASTPPQAAGGSNVTGPATLLQHTTVAYRQHPLYDQFWKERSVKARWPRLTIPVLELDGWYDRYRDGMTKNQMARPNNVWLVMGPWTHGATQAQAQPVGNGAYLAWFDHWLRGDSRAPLPRAKVTSYETALAAGEETGWYQFSSWPPAETSTRIVHLTAAHSLASTAGVRGEHSYVVDPFDPGNDKSHSYPVNQGDQRVQDGRRLTYDLAPFSSDAVLAGAIEVRLRVKVSANDANLVVRLEDVAPDGTSTRISAGWLKLSHRAGHDHLEPVSADRVYIANVHVWPKHHRFPKGHVLRLAISSGDFPEIAADAPPGTVTLLTGPGGSTATIPLLRLR